MIGQLLLFQDALIRPQFLIQFLAPPREGFSQPLPSLAGLGLSFPRALCPLPESSETLFQVRSSFRSLRILYRDLGKPVVGVQSQRQKIVFDDIFLGRPAMNIGLGKYHQRLSFASDRKSTRLNSSHLVISYAVFCLKKKIACHFGRLITI